ncbi:MAG TPA: MFS transporter [Polyangiales bacterium]|nr:MFS transporter [Polyangiales bacterium]
MPDSAGLSEPVRAPTPFVAFEFRDFRLFQASSLLSTIGLQMQAVAVGWQVYALTGKALDLGYVGLALFAPSLLFAMVTGQAADRIDRRKLLIACHLLLLVASLALLLVTQVSKSTLAIYAILLVIGTARAFQAPTGQALMPNLVPLSAFPNAVAWSSTTWQISVVAGPALGGLLYAAGGAGKVYACATLLELITVSVLLAIRTRTARSGQTRNSMRELSAGLRFVWQKPVIFGAISLDLFAVLFGGAVALLPIYARDILHTGPSGLGLLRSAPAVGALIIALWLAYRPVLRRAGVTMFACVAAFGLAMIAFAVSQSLWLSLAALALSGAADMVSVFIRHSLVQLRTPDVMRGRVAAVNMIFIGASNELGEFESGVVAQWLGAVPAVVCGGIATCVVVLLWAWWFPALRKIDRLDDTVAT